MPPRATCWDVTDPIGRPARPIEERAPIGIRAPGPAFVPAPSPAIGDATRISLAVAGTPGPGAGQKKAANSSIAITLPRATTSTKSVMRKPGPASVMPPTMMPAVADQSRNSGQPTATAVISAPERPLAADRGA